MNKYKFKELAVGDVFIFEDDVYLKTGPNIAIPDENQPYAPKRTIVRFEDDDEVTLH